MFAKNLIFYRENQNLSQEELAQKLSVSKQSIYKWEKGICYPDINNLINIANYFNINIDSLINKEIKSKKKKSQLELLLSLIKTITIPIILIIIFTEKKKL
ncbi:helix-turn-helix transcriptional regulator [uncultured Muribaculum sp.]|uniref:helix-turn-helix domain-containing protein n=1 Tax=uncultured Muribaculum sp. TaxID=1918613 RepID=UPI00321FE305